MTQKQIENAYVDIIKNLIGVPKEMNEVNFWPIYNGIVLCYKKSKLKSELEENYTGFLYRDISEKHLKSLQKLMTTLPEYNQFFDNEDAEQNIKDYLKLCPNELLFEGNDYEKIIKQTLERVVNYMSTRPKTIKKVDDEIDRQVFMKEVEDFAENKRLITPQFINAIKSQRGEDGIKSLYEHMRELAKDAIYSQSIYYNRVAKNICNFYANIEMEKNIESEIE